MNQDQFKFLLQLTSNHLNLTLSLLKSHHEAVEQLIHYVPEKGALLRIANETERIQADVEKTKELLQSFCRNNGL